MIQVKYCTIQVKYTRYANDFLKMTERKIFDSLEEVADWLFECCNGSYKKNMFFIDPDSTTVYLDGKLKLDSSYISVGPDDIGWSNLVELIIDDGIIIYSTGKFTDGICHWNEKVKQWLRDCRARQMNPKFNFG